MTIGSIVRGGRASRRAAPRGSAGASPSLWAGAAADRAGGARLVADGVEQVLQHPRGNLVLRGGVDEAEVEQVAQQDALSAVATRGEAADQAAPVHLGGAGLDQVGNVGAVEPL